MNFPCFSIVLSVLCHYHTPVQLRQGHEKVWDIASLNLLQFRVVASFVLSQLFLCYTDNYIEAKTPKLRQTLFLSPFSNFALP